MGRRRYAAALLLLAGALLASCVAPREFRLAPAERRLAASPAALPTRYAAGFILVEATLDGRGPVLLVLDTGASVLTLDAEAVERLGLAHGAVLGGGHRIRAADGSSVASTRAAHVDELRAGPLTLRDVDAVVLDLTILRRACGLPVAGLLGAPAVDGLLLTLDVAGRAVTVAEGTLPPPDGRDVLPLTEDALPTVVLDVGGRPVPFLVDSGGTHFLALPAAVADGLPFRSPVVETGRSATVAGTAVRRDGRLAADVTFGRHRVAAPVVSVTPAEGASLGLAFLESFRTTIDLAGRRIRFERDAASPVRTAPIRSPGAGFVQEGGAWVVAYVLPGSGAQRAGLAPGDRVETVEGLPVAQVGDALRQVLFLASDSVRLGVARPDGVREVVVEVATLVE